MKNKDWTGGNASVFKALGATNHSDSDRASEDFYATDSIAIDALKSKVDLPHFILEPACGRGDLSERLKELGHKVWSYDIVNRGYGDVQNFFEMLTLPSTLSLSLSLQNGRFEKFNENRNNMAIVTNPPYKCYDSETEVYTKRGWLRYDEVRSDDEVMSVNPYTQELEWSGINEIIIRDMEPNETMFHFKKRNLDVMVTNGHRMFCKTKQTGRLDVRKGDLIKSDDIRSTHYIPRLGYKWHGDEVDTFVIPGIHGHSYAQPCYKKPIVIKMDDWLDFFGLWLADGCCRHTMNSQGNPRKTVCIKQLASNADRIRKALDKLPFEYKERTDGYNRENECVNFVINNEQLWSYLLQFGYASDKFVPEQIKNLSVRQLKLFLQAYLDGDGSIGKDDVTIYRTASKRLIEDVQEILLKLGCLGHVTTSSYTTQEGEDKALYELRIAKKDSIYNNIYFPSNKGGKCRVEYSGLVWCLNLKKNGVFLLRRNGKEFFCGNCALEFIIHALELCREGDMVCMFVKTTFLEGKRRYRELFSQQPPWLVLQFVERILCAKNGDFEEARRQGSAVSYCWCCWVKGFSGRPTIDWV